jgi:diguanylate cyclase (GGDEF)-like protein
VHATFLALAILATMTTGGLLVWTLMSRGARVPVEVPRQDRRRTHSSRQRDPREALALVGDALAATHNPRVLLPVILEVVTEATGGSGGQVLVGGHEVAWIGKVGGSNGEPLSLGLGSSPDGETTLRVYPPEAGFSNETNELAEWLASQAGVALENARLHDVVQRQAITDDLTGLVNRRRFIEALQAEVDRARRFHSPLAVILADLDNFKRVNDDFGHHGGDVVLRSFAELLRSHVRDLDVPGRIGGEEFAIVLPQTAAEDAAIVAERMRHSLTAVSVPVGDGRSVWVTSSFGVADLASETSGDDLLRVADEALYQAKSAGKNRVVTSSAATRA